MILNATEGKENVRSVSAGQGCSDTELRIVGNSITALRSLKLHYIFHCSLAEKTHALIRVHPEFPETILKN